MHLAEPVAGSLLIILIASRNAAISQSLLLLLLHCTANTALSSISISIGRSHRSSANGSAARRGEAISTSSIFPIPRFHGSWLGLDVDDDIVLSPLMRTTRKMSMIGSVGGWVGGLLVEGLHGWHDGRRQTIWGPCLGLAS